MAVTYRDTTVRYRDIRVTYRGLDLRISERFQAAPVERERAGRVSGVMVGSRKRMTRRLPR